MLNIFKMWSYKKAKKIALEYLNKDLKDYKIQLYEPGKEFEYGWIFYYDTAGVFHPKLHEINAKINMYSKSGKTDKEIEELLSSKERDILSNSIGLVGNLPLFIDKETFKISFHSPPTEAIQQEIFELKTGKNFVWEIYISEITKGDLKIFKTLQSITNLEKIEILKAIKEKKPVAKAQSFRTLLDFKKLLDANKVLYTVIKIEKEEDK